MYSRLLDPPKGTSYFLFGPRGTGKTTWVKENYPNALYFDLLNSKTYHEFMADPSLLEVLARKAKFDWIIFDEIQMVPELLNEVHRLIEGKHYKFILTGSSARKLRRGGVNLLAGRALNYYLHPLTAIEMGGDFDLEKSLFSGLLPMATASFNTQEYLQTYVNAHLYQEVEQEGMTRNLSNFARFLETASFSQGSVLNMSEVAREAMVERKVVENYFQILDDLLVGVQIPVFTKRAKRKMITHNKFYYFDAGIFRTLRPTGPFDDPNGVSGVALETIFLQNLRAINDYFKLHYTIYYYRTVQGVEVDFVVYGEKGLIAFEVKATDKFPRHDLRGLKIFLKDYPMARGYLLYGGDRKMYFGNIEVWPASEALKNLPQILENKI